MTAKIYKFPDLKKTNTRCCLCAVTANGCTLHHAFTEDGRRRFTPDGQRIVGVP